MAELCDGYELRIGRLYAGADNGERVQIEVRKARARVCVVELPLADFARAVMGELVQVKSVGWADA